MTNSCEKCPTLKGHPFLALIEKQLRRGNFLKGDDRSLRRILEEDAATVSRLGIEIEEVACMMERMYDIGRTGLGDAVIIDETFEVTVQEDRGIIPSPWADHYPAPKAIVRAVNMRNGRTLKFSMLGLHLIRCHGFFQGKGSPFRIEPKDLYEFFCET